jgi:hypothetical protein
VQRAREAGELNKQQQAGDQDEYEIAQHVLLAMQASEEEAKRKEEEDVERAMKESMRGA